MCSYIRDVDRLTLTVQNIAVRQAIDGTFVEGHDVLEIIKKT